MLKIYPANQFNLQEYLSQRTKSISVKEKKVKNIIENVLQFKDQALLRYAQQWDHSDLKKVGFKTTSAQIKTAFQRMIKKDPEYIKTIKTIITRLERFHKYQIEKGFVVVQNKDEILGQMIIPIEKILVYLPGGNTIYPSTLLMNLVPAKLAGVKHIYITTPLKNNQPIFDEILSILYLMDIPEIYHVGGAHGIAGFTFGTDKLPKVYKIVGPGNDYIVLAKKLLFGSIAIDMPAGPSEVVIIADKTANPEYIALDLLSQAEHIPMAPSILITDSLSLAHTVNKKIELLLHKFGDNNIKKAILSCFILVVKNKQEAFNISNEIAPEHLEIFLPNPKKYLPLIKNAGSVFLGEYSPTAIGDYYSGTNHTLPTLSSAKSFSQLGVYDFIKHTSYTYFSKNQLFESKKYIKKIADIEKFKFHSLSVLLRK